jgi:ABC-type phosphate transport system auxiliary subunit
MKNYEISNANYVLSQLIDEPLKGKFKFKVFNVKSELEKRVEVITKSLEGVEDESEHEEILQEEQEVKIDKFTEDELEQIDLSLRQISMLKPIIKENE